MWAEAPERRIGDHPAGTFVTRITEPEAQMKSIMPVLLLLAAPVVMADQAVDVTWVLGVRAEDATWAKLHILTTERIQLLRQQGVSDAGIEALRDYLYRGDGQLTNVTRAQLLDLCARRTVIEEGGEDGYAHELQKLHRAIRDTQQELVNNVDHALSPADQERLHYVLVQDLQGPEPAARDSSSSATIRRESTPISPTLDQLCGSNPARPPETSQ